MARANDYSNGRLGRLPRRTLYRHPHSYNNPPEVVPLTPRLSRDSLNLVLAGMISRLWEGSQDLTWSL